MAGPLVVVQNNLVDPLTAPVALHARAAGLDLLDLSLTAETDFAATGEDFAARPAVLLHGAVGFLKAALAHPPLRERLAWDEESFLADRWARDLGGAYLGHGDWTMRAGEVGAALSRGGTLAVRPLLGLKAFKGGVYDLASWREAKVAPDVACFAAAPSRILAEHRVWFVGGVPVAGSLYLQDGRLQKGMDGVAEAMADAARLAEDCLPLDDIVMDVALTPEGRKVVEYNCIHSSAFYVQTCT